MPLNAKGEKIKFALAKEYGAEKGERVLYAGKNKGTFTGIDSVKADKEKLSPEALLKAAEDELEAIGKEEVEARAGAVDDRMKVIRQLREEMRGDKDPVGSVVQMEREQELMQRLVEAVAEIAKRMDRAERAR